MSISHLQADMENFNSTRGMLFFGVPNQGMDIKSLIPMVGNQANREFLESLKSNSTVLRVQAQKFLNTLESLQCSIMNFYETEESPTAERKVTTQLRRSHKFV